MIHDNTPIERYTVNGRIIHVKREDMCIGGPAFSKMRGVAAHLKKRPETTIGVLDTFHSKAGWGTAMLCREMGKKCVVFYPVYQSDLGFRVSQSHAFQEGAIGWGLKAGRSCILYHEAKKNLASCYPNSYMMPNALKLEETVEETAREVLLTPAYLLGSDSLWVISVSSGTVGAGVVKGLAQAQAGCRVILHMGYSRSAESLMRYIIDKAPGANGVITMHTIDEGYDYKDACNYPAPFPCNPYYDRKAWKWLSDNVQTIPETNIVFWDIGA